MVPPESWDALDAALERLPHYDWLVFTSVNGVDYFFQRLIKKNRDARALGHLRTAAIGPATAGRLRRYGLSTDILPKTYQAESVVDAFAQQAIHGKKILLPRAKEARTVLPESLTSMGAVVDEITVYRTMPSSENRSLLIDGLQAGTIDMVTFTSSSTVSNFKCLLPEDLDPALMEKVAVACIGNITAETAKQLGFRVDLTADIFTIEGLCDAIERYYHP